MTESNLACTVVADPDELAQLMATYSLEKTVDIVFAGIPLPPSSNNIYTNSRHGGRVKGSEMRHWEKDFAVWALDNAQGFARARQLAAARLKPGTVLAVHCTFFFKYERLFSKKGAPKRLDASNRIKALHDALAETLGVDDCWFFDGMTRKRPVEALYMGGEEGATVEIEFLDAPWARLVRALK